MVKIILSFPIALFMFSCSSQKDSKDIKVGSIFKPFSVSTDTVSIDSKEQIFFLNHQLLISDISDDEKYLYNFNDNEHLIEKINLDDLEAEGTYPLEKEGPNGIGTNVWSIKYIENDTFFIGSYERNGIINLEEKKYQKLSFDRFNLTGDQISPGARIIELIPHPHKKNMLFVLFQDYNERSISFCRINTYTNEAKVYDLPTLEELRDHHIPLIGENGKIESMIGPKAFIDLFGDKIFISNSIENSIYILDINNDQVSHKEIATRLTNNAKKQPKLRETFSMKSFLEQTVLIREDVNFTRIVKDSTKNQYYRFCFQETFDQERLIEGPKATINFISIFDANLELINEFKIDSLQTTPQKFFVKNEKIWVFKNIEDEMGFIRISFEG